MSVYNNLLSTAKSDFSGQQVVLNDSFLVSSDGSSSSAETRSTITSALANSRFFPDAKKTPQQQSLLREKIVQYLQHEMELSPTDCDSVERQRVIEYFENARGICLALAVLWAYAKR